MHPTESPPKRRLPRRPGRTGRALEVLHKLVTGAAALAALLRMLL